jgi:RNA polymerase sigma-70 factor (ECF subfamily)
MRPAREEADSLRSTQDKADRFLELLRPLQQPLEIYSRRMLRTPSLVEDVLQSAVARAFIQFDRYAEGTNFRAWIFRFVTLEIFNRNRKVEPVFFGEVPPNLAVEETGDLLAQEDTVAAILEDPDAALEHFDDVVVEALQRLAPLERAVLLLRSIGEFSYKEIHELLAIPLGSVMGYLSRARKQLRLSLADYAAQCGLFRPDTLPGGPHQ